jgi:hypothetical protein
MATPFEELEKRLTSLEQELARLRQQVEGLAPRRAMTLDDIPMIREAKATQPAITAAVTKAFAEMGITGEPVGAEKLQQMMIDAGVKPEDNIFSREIIAMREE